MNRLYAACGGRSMTIAWAVLLLGTALAAAERLTGEYVAVLGIVQGLVVARAAVEDWKDSRNGGAR